MTVPQSEDLLHGQRVRLTGVAAERVLGECAGALGLVLHQERVERGERHGPGWSVRGLRPACSLVEHRGGRGWDVGAGAERDDQEEDKTTHQVAFGGEGRQPAVTSSRGGW